MIAPHRYGPSIPLGLEGLRSHDLGGGFGAPKIAPSDWWA
jgi:hypothetical protein